MQHFKLTIPGQPKGKQRPQFNSVNPHGYTPTQTLNYEAYVKWFIYQQWDKGVFASWTNAKEPLVLFCASWHELPASKSKDWKNAKNTLYHVSKPDFDNVAKIVADSLNKLVFPDDAQIAASQSFKIYAPPGKPGFVNVDIYPLAGATPQLFYDYANAAMHSKVLAD